MAKKFMPAPMPVQDKFIRTRTEMNARLIERDTEVDLALTALVAQQHLLLVGPPGTAKSMVVETIRSWIDGGKSLTIHCCKDTTRNVAFGPMKLSALKQDRTERALEGGAADVHVLVLEEVFKAGPAVLDMFLMLMNERIYREGLVAAKAPLRLLLGVSNEWAPEGCGAALAAFFDRFLFRAEVKPIRSREGLLKLMAIPTASDNEDRSHVPQLSTRISLEEIDAAHQQAMRIRFTNEAADAMLEIRSQLEKEGVVPGDRRQKQAVAAAQAYAWTLGHKMVEVEDLEILSHVLWNDPQEQPGVAARVVAKVANPTGMLINAKLVEMDDVIAKCKPMEAVPKLQAIVKEMAQMKQHPKLVSAMEYASDRIREMYNEVIGLKDVSKAAAKV